LEFNSIVFAPQAKPFLPSRSSRASVQILLFSLQDYLTQKMQRIFHTRYTLKYAHALNFRASLKSRSPRRMQRMWQDSHSGIPNCESCHGVLKQYEKTGIGLSLTYRAG
jgi:hypothetical protein